MKILMPVKSVSVRCKDKNFREFGVTSLYERAVDKYLPHAPLFVDFDGVVEDLEELEGLTIYPRHESHIGPDVSMNNIICRFLDTYVEDSNEIVCQLHVTSPFLEYSTIKRALNSLRASGDKYDSCFAVSTETSRVWDYNRLTQQIFPVNHNPIQKPSTQLTKPLYIENSAFYLFTKDSFGKAGGRIGMNPMLFDIQKLEALDIDTEDDFGFCSSILEGESL